MSARTDSLRDEAGPEGALEPFLVIEEATALEEDRLLQVCRLPEKKLIETLRGRNSRACSGNRAARRSGATANSRCQGYEGTVVYLVLSVRRGIACLQVFMIREGERIASPKLPADFFTITGDELKREQERMTVQVDRVSTVAVRVR